MRLFYGFLRNPVIHSVCVRVYASIIYIAELLQCALQCALQCVAVRVAVCCRLFPEFTPHMHSLLQSVLQTHCELQRSVCVAEECTCCRVCVLQSTVSCRGVYVLQSMCVAEHSELQRSVCVAEFVCCRAL